MSQIVVDNTLWQLEYVEPWVKSYLEALGYHWYTASVNSAVKLKYTSDFKTYYEPEPNPFFQMSGGALRIITVRTYDEDHPNDPVEILRFRWDCDDGSTTKMSLWFVNRTLIDGTYRFGMMIKMENDGGFSKDSNVVSAGQILNAVNLMDLGQPYGLSLVYDYSYSSTAQIPYFGLCMLPLGFDGAQFPYGEWPGMPFTYVMTEAGAEEWTRFFLGSGVVDEDLFDPSEPAGGGGSDTYVDDEIDFPDVPVDTVLDSEFLRLYHINTAQLNAIGRALWSQNFFDNILKNYDSPFENIISLNMLPVNVSGTSALVVIGNYDTNVTGERVNTQFVDLDGGSVQIPKIFGNQLDFDPASTCQIFIPFIGYRDIDLDDLSGGVASLKYRIDLLTGNVLAMLKITQTDRYRHDSVEYHFNGNCATSIPISGANYMQLYSGIMSGALGAISSGARGNLIGVAGGASSILTSKPGYQRSGNLSGNVGYMGQLRAYILLSSPIQEIPGNLKMLKGLRSNIYRDFANLTGLQVIEEFRPNNTLTKACTEEELEMIRAELAEGVIF